MLTYLQEKRQMRTFPLRFGHVLTHFCSLLITTSGGRKIEDTINRNVKK